MKASALLTFIVLVLTSCGGRNTSVENEEAVAASDTVVVSDILAEVRDGVNTHPPLALTDSMRLDSVWMYGRIGYSNLNEIQVKEIFTDYILYCHNEDGVEGIIVNFGEAFVRDDTFYDWVLDVYSVLEGRNQERYKRWLCMSFEDYTTIWAWLNPEFANYFDLQDNCHLNEDKYCNFISNLDVEQLKDLRDQFHNGNYDFMEPFIEK